MSLDQRQPGWHSMRAITVLPTVTIRFATLGPDTISSGWSIDLVLITPIQNLSRRSRHSTEGLEESLVKMWPNVPVLPRRIERAAAKRRSRPTAGCYAA